MITNNQQVLNLQEGNEAALSFFISSYSQKLLFFAFKIVKDKSIAEEIASDAFVKLWERRANFYTEDCVKSFLYLVTRNSCFDILKQSRHKFQHEESFLIDLQNQEQDTLTKLIYFELIEQIALEIEKLPKKQAQIVQLSLIEGMATEEICEELNTSASMVYFAKSKAISKLKQSFQQKNISYYQILIIWSIIIYSYC